MVWGSMSIDEGFMMRTERMDESVVVVKYVWSGKGGKVRGEKIRK